jgi:hypothetical protein
MMGKGFSKSLLEADIQRTNIEDRLNEASYDYHSNLLKLLDEKKHSANKDMRLWEDTIKGFQTCIALNNNIISLSMDIVKSQLEEAFKNMGINKKELTDRVHSGETIVGGKKKMHWMEDGWKEGEKDG